MFSSIVSYFKCYIKFELIVCVCGSVHMCIVRNGEPSFILVHVDIWFSYYHLCQLVDISFFLLMDCCFVYLWLYILKESIVILILLFLLSSLFFHLLCFGIQHELGFFFFFVRKRIGTLMGFQFLVICTLLIFLAFIKKS